MKKIWVSVTLLLSFFVGIFMFSMRVNAAPVPEGLPFSEQAWETLMCINKERAIEEFPDVEMLPYTAVEDLQELCDLRAEELKVCYSHETRPDGSPYYTALYEVIPNWRTAEEFWAEDAKTSEEIVNYWMNSSNDLSVIYNHTSQHFGISQISDGKWVATTLGADVYKFETLTFEFPNALIVAKGTAIEDMKLYGKISSEMFKTSYFPIISEYCTGYDSNKCGTQTVTITAMGKTQTINITVSDFVPDKPYKITNTVSGVHVYWNAEKGAEKYGVWRSETGINGTYKWIANPSTNHFTDIKVESGKTYYYKITVLNTEQNKHYDKSPAIGITYVSTPDITSRVNKAAGIELGWNAVKGATGYAIYRKPYSGNSAWVRVATITDTTARTWIDTSVKTANGSIYRYTIRALAGSNRNTLSGCRNTGRTMVRLTSRTLNSATKVNATSIKCNWGTTSQATGYEVRFMVGSTVYKTYTVTDYKTGVKTFTGLKTGQTYKVQVRSYKKVDGVGSFYSAWSTAKYVNL